MKIAITGISGHLGNNVARALLAENFSVKALVRQKNTPSINDLDIELIEVELLLN